MSRLPGDKPIEGHLQDLGFNPDRLTDEERREIALAIQDVLTFGTGILAMIGRIHHQDPINWLRRAG